MENIKEELKKVINDVMIPETQAYIEDIKKDIENKSASKDDMDAKEEMEFFVDELKTIIKVIEEDKLSDEDAKSVYEKITTMLEEHE